MAVLAALVLSGFVVLGIAWRGAAAEVDMARQVPFLVSGGLGGLGLVAVGAAIASIQARRLAEARRRAALDEAVRATLVLLERV